MLITIRRLKELEGSTLQWPSIEGSNEDPDPH